MAQVVHPQSRLADRSSLPSTSGPRASSCPRSAGHPSAPRTPRRLRACLLSNGKRWAAGRDQRDCAAAIVLERVDELRTVGPAGQKGPLNAKSRTRDCDHVTDLKAGSLSPAKARQLKDEHRVGIAALTCRGESRKLRRGEELALTLRLRLAISARTEDGEPFQQQVFIDANEV